MKQSLVEFFYENGGKNLNTMMELAEKDNEFRTELISMFFFNTVPSKEFFAQIRAAL